MGNILPSVTSPLCPVKDIRISDDKKGAKIHHHLLTTRPPFPYYHPVSTKEEPPIKKPKIIHNREARCTLL
jgi:hypothetical protein